MIGKVRFLDDTATTSDGTLAVVTGIVNGEPITMPDGTRFVPVWAERDNGREPTTILVKESNLLPD